MLKSKKEQNLIIIDFIIENVLPLFEYILENDNKIGMTADLINSTKDNVLRVSKLGDERANQLLIDFILNVAEPTIQELVTENPFTIKYIDINELLITTKRSLNI